MLVKKIGILVLLFFLACDRSADSIHLDVERYTLENGFTVLLLPREGAPVFSAYIRVKVGSIEEPAGASGLAHFFEHMAFKGTEEIGTSDFKKESEILEKMYAVGTKITTLEKAKASAEELKPLYEELDEFQKQHEEVIVQNEFVQLYQRNGGSNINATTTTDFTSYFVSLPSNKLELWAYLESRRFLNPVLREFYKERDVVAEERRMRYDSNPDGRLYESLLDMAFDESPYKINVIGLPEDIRSYTFETAQDFFKKYYIPSRTVIALVGRFDERKAVQLIEKYFGEIPKRPDPSQTPDNKLKQGFDRPFPREKVIKDSASPRFFLGYHRPAFPHSDDPVLDVIESILCDGRSSRLYQSLVQRQKIAANVGCYAGIPGARLDSLFTFYAEPLESSSNRAVWQAIFDELKLLQEEGVKADELDKVKKKVEADMIWALKSNMGLASLLTFYEILAGDWKYLYKVEKQIEKITPAQVQEVARKYFVPEKSVTIFMERNSDAK